MAGSPRQAEIASAPEINLARRLITKLGLSPPIPISNVLRQYATVEVIPIPFNVDGICIGLKIPGRQPKVIVNAFKPVKRRRFTMAHEFGHIVIPWHTGLIVDQLRIRGSTLDSNYWAFEAEANRFASELLMPTDWARPIVQSSRKPTEAIEQIIEEANISFDAAYIKTIGLLVSGYTYARSENDRVVASGASRGTFVPSPIFGSSISEYEFSTKSIDYSISERSASKYHFWHFVNDEILFDEVGDWREVLEQILGDFDLADDIAKKFKMSLNGVVASANSGIKFDRTYSNVYNACFFRVQAAARDRYLFRFFIGHSLFESFLKLRVNSFLVS